MGILKAVGDWLFGKDPDIFDDKGQVRHKFTEKKWQDWDNRLKANPDYDWHNHKGRTPDSAKNSVVKPPANPVKS